MNRAPYAYLIDRLLASDPALDRFRSGVRAVLTAGLAAGVFLLLSRWLDLDYELALAGIVVPTIAVVAMQEPGRTGQQVTMAWVPVVAGTMLVVGSFIADNPWLGGACFILTIFAAFQARRFGPRGASLGTIAYQSFFYAMLFKNPPDEVPWVVLFVAIGCAIAHAVHFRLVPEHPGQALPGELRAFHARIRALLHDLARWLERDGKRMTNRVDAQLAALSAQSLALDERLARFAGKTADASGLREQVLHGDIAAETVAAVARSAQGDGVRRPLAIRLRALRDALDKDHVSDPPPPPGLPAASHWRLGRAVRTLAGLPAWHQPLPAMSDDGKHPAPANGPAAVAASGRQWFDDTTRRALQACAAALGALLAGRAISPEHWYWAVFAAFVVFTRATTVGQTLSGAWRQVLAAGAGLCVGVAFAELVHGNRNVELVLLFVFIALGFYAFRGMQNVYTVLLTAMLAMLYELLGMDSAGMLVIRLEETVAGAAIAVLAARLVLPLHTRDESDAKSADLLRVASLLLGAAMLEPPRQAPYDAVRELDRKLQAVRQSLGPVTVAAYPAAKANRRRHLDRLARIAYCIRHAYVLAAGQPTPPEALRAAIRVLRPRLDGVATMLESTARPAQPGADLARLPPVDATASRDVRTDVVTALLAEADALLRDMQARLMTPRP